ncbi:MAG: hypothetical protein IPG63_14140 [Xanthomonadales bacterium]|nr:hypothetical protein [Xanthomonadales bacterium]
MRLFTRSTFTALCLLLVAALAAPTASALGTEFTYQGRLQDDIAPAQGLYDFEFRLHDNLIGGNQVGPLVTLADIPVEHGVFTVQLDFGPGMFAGEARWLSIAVREGAGSGSYEALTPRQPLSATPYAQHAMAPSGVVRVLDFDAKWSPANTLGNNGNAILTPSVCRTVNNPPYTAGAGEVAIVHLDATAASSSPVADALYLNVMMSVNGGAFAIQTLEDSAESMADGTAHVSTSKRINLVAGWTYLFAAGVSTNTPLSISTGYCHGTVLIVKQP